MCVAVHVDIVEGEGHVEHGGAPGVPGEVRGLRNDDFMLNNDDFLS